MYTTVSMYSACQTAVKVILSMALTSLCCLLTWSSQDECFFYFFPYGDSVTEMYIDCAIQNKGIKS